MHEKYTTRGIVICASAYREADKIISIYTEDFGLISAVATGVRNAASKLRYHTQDFSVRDFSLVRGRDLWRLVGAEDISDRADSAQAGASGNLTGENLAVYARVISLIRRLVRGEEKNERVFLTLFTLHLLLVQEDPVIDLSAAETLAVFRILHDLGYIKSDTSSESLIAPLEINQSLAIMAKPLVPKLISAINKGLTESHL